MPFRNARASCPSCRSELDLSNPLVLCESCRGGFISEAELEERVRSIRGRAEPSIAIVFGASLEEQFPKPGDRERLCPTCREPMRKLAIAGVCIDRCEKQHGIWFDAEELAAVLLASRDGHGVLINPVSLGPQERAALARIEQELADNHQWDTGDTLEAGFDTVGIIAWILSLFVD